MWRLFKLLLSTCLVAGAIGMAVTATDPSGWGVAGVLVFFAAAPWVAYDRPSRSLALVAVVVAIWFGFIAVATLNGSITFPRQCGGRRRLFCELENLLYLVGGRPATALPWLMMAAGATVGAWRAYVRARAD